MACTTNCGCGSCGGSGSACQTADPVRLGTAADKRQSGRLGASCPTLFADYYGGMEGTPDSGLQEDVEQDPIALDPDKQLPAEDYLQQRLDEMENEVEDLKQAKRRLVIGAGALVAAGFIISFST